MKLTLTINNQEITIELDEARALWKELDSLFRKEQKPVDRFKDWITDPRLRRYTEPESPPLPHYPLPRPDEVVPQSPWWRDKVTC